MGNRRNTYRITYYEQQKLKITVVIYYTTSVSRALPNSQLLHSDIPANNSPTFMSKFLRKKIYHTVNRMRNFL